MNDESGCCEDEWLQAVLGREKYMAMVYGEIGIFHWGALNTLLCISLFISIVWGFIFYFKKW